MAVAARVAYLVTREMQMTHRVHISLGSLWVVGDLRNDI